MRLLVSERQNAWPSHDLLFSGAFPEHLWDMAYGFPLTSLVYARGLDGNVDLFRDSQLVTAMSLMSDVFDIPLSVVVLGGERLQPNNDCGVVWAMLEDLVHAKKSMIYRVNGLFGPDLVNAIHAALAESLVFDDTRLVNPIATHSLDSWMMADSFDWMGPQCVGGQSTTWYGYASERIDGAKPWRVKPVGQKYGQRASSHRASKTHGPHDWDDSWSMPHLAHDNDWNMRSEGVLQAMAEERGHRAFSK